MSGLKEFSVSVDILCMFSIFDMQVLCRILCELINFLKLLTYSSKGIVIICETFTVNVYV